MSKQQSTSVPNFNQFDETSDFETKFAQKILYSGVLGQTQPENNLF